MFYHLLLPYQDSYPFLRLIQYVSFRTFMTILTALLVYLMFGQRMINWLTAKQCTQTVRNDGPQSHLHKKTTPTMGGVLIMGSVFFSMLLWGRLDNIGVIFTLAMGLVFALIGFYDDYRKLILRDANGLRARYKFPLQMGFAVLGCLILFDGFAFDTRLAVPFFKALSPDLGGFYVVFAALVIVGSSNAVNLTDGLDGLVTGPSIVSYLTYAVFAYVVGHATIAKYLQVPFAAATGIPGSAELTVLCGAVVGALIGFLWYNAHPALIFMGDVGSLPLGAMLGSIAVLTKNELLLVLVGGVFVIETLSVIVQVASFKLRGKRVFRMAPIHHHFELKGWPESRVIVRFWIISLVLALLSLTTLKLR